MPIKVLAGHLDRVYHVVFNKNIHNIVVSGSDDRTIRVWDINRPECNSIQVLGGYSVTGSHTANIRALEFLPEISWCLISGSWDSTIKLWDIRSGHCMFTLEDHNSDVYGITIHPERPFLFGSCSRDTTLRLFNIDGIIVSLKMQLLLAENSEKNK